jgi:hypothetical protein
MYERAVSTHAAFAQARALVTQLDAMSGPDVAALKAKVEALAPASALPRNARNARRRGPAGAPVHLESASNAALAAALAMQSADVARPQPRRPGFLSARSQTTTVLAAWNRLRQTELAVSTRRARRDRARCPCRLTVAREFTECPEVHTLQTGHQNRSRSLFCQPATTNRLPEAAGRVI